MRFGSRRDRALGQDKDQLIGEMREALARAAVVRASGSRTQADRADRAHLRRYQTERLAQTHADLLASPRYGPAAAFFLSDLYGMKERAARDETVARLVPIIARMLPSGAMHALAVATWLDALSEELDLAMVSALREEGALQALDHARYARAWRRCGRREDRARQLEMVGEVGRVLDRLTKMNSIRIALRLMRAPAHAAGFGGVQEFLERGFCAFADIGDASEFLDILISRESTVAERLFSGGTAVGNP